MLDSWPLSQLIVKSTFLKKLVVNDLDYTTPENRSVLVNFFGELCQQNGNYLEELVIQNTDSTVEDGQKFAEALNESTITRLQKVWIGEPRWFSKGR